MNAVSPQPPSTQRPLALRSRPETGRAHEAAVARAINALREDTEGTISLTDLSKAAGLSRFHFNRIFHRIVGIPPCQFRSLLRLDAARRLLLTTSRSIIDVSFDVGYQSLGTFTRRFTGTLGLPPFRLRQAARLVSVVALRPSIQSTMPPPAPGTIRGLLTGPPDVTRGVILLGLFDSPAPQGYPARCCALDGPGPFCFTDVADGSYYLMAAAFADDDGPAQRLLHENIPRAAARQSPLVVRNGEVVSGTVDLELRGPHVFDPPILTALLPLLAGRRSSLAQPSSSNCGEDSCATHAT